MIDQELLIQLRQAFRRVKPLEVFETVAYACQEHKKSHLLAPSSHLAYDELRSGAARAAKRLG